MTFVVYMLGTFSRAFAVISAAASSILAEVLGRVAGLDDVPGFSGRGGGALSGSELSHLVDKCQGPRDGDMSAKENLHRDGSSTRFRKGMLMLEHKRVLVSIPRFPRVPRLISLS